MWGLRNHNEVWIIPNPGSQKTITLSLYSISKIPFQTGTSYVKIPEWDSTVPTTEGNASSVSFVPFGGHGISLIRIQVCVLGVQRISLRILPIVRYSGQVCWLPEKLVKWGLSDVPMTGAIVAPAGSRFCVSHHQSRLFISLRIWWLSESTKSTGSKPRCAWNGRCANRNWIHLKIFLQYNVPKIGAWSSIELSSPSPKLNSERRFCTISADWKNSILKMSSPCLRCWSIHVVTCWLNDWACWKSYTDWNGWHGFHCSEYLWCLLYNPVALLYTLPPTLSTPTTCLWALVCVGSGVNLKSGFWRPIVSSSGVSLGGGTLGILFMGKLLVD